MDCLYETPLALHANGLDNAVAKALKLKGRTDLTEWRKFIRSVKAAKKSVEIALVGKYVHLHDAYLSVVEALKAGGFALGANVSIKWVDSGEVNEKTEKEIFADADGIIIPGGFGDRATDGMIETCRYARENKVPCLGICLGMQMMVVEYAKDVLGLDDATSGEFDEKAKNKVIDLMPDQKNVDRKGGTMRLGAYPCELKEGTKIAAAYGVKSISERHRHRYEFNNDYRESLSAAGLTLSGTSPDGRLVETVEVTSHPYYVGCQFHPEFKSRPDKAHPLFKGLIAAALDK